MAVGSERCSGVDQVVELAAKTGAGNFADLKALGAQVVGIDQPIGLIIGNQPDLQAQVGVVPG